MSPEALETSAERLSRPSEPKESLFEPLLATWANLRPVSTELWSNRDNSIQYNSPVLNNELIFGLSARDALFCINEKDGTTAWTSPITGKRGFGSIVSAGSVLFLLTPAGNLVAFEPSGKEFKQLASYKVADGDTTAYPVLAGNQIFVKDKDSVTLWTAD